MRDAHTKDSFVRTPLTFLCSLVKWENGETKLQTREEWKEKLLGFIRKKVEVLHRLLQGEQVSVVSLEPTLYPTKPPFQAKCACGCNSGRKVTGQPTAFGLDFRPAPQKRIKTWYHKPDEKWRLRRGYRPSKELTTVVLLKDMWLNCLLNNYRLHTQISATLNLSQRSFSL